MSSPDPLQPLRDHRIFGMADTLAKYVGINRDLVQFVEFLSLAAGKMAMPINLEIVSEQWTADLFIANRILDLQPELVRRVDTDSQFRELEKAGFEKVAAILVRDSHPNAFRNFIDRTARSVNGGGSMPSLWRIADRTPAVTADPSVLRLITPNASRDLGKFGSAFATAPDPEAGKELTGLLNRLSPSPKYECSFSAQYSGTLPALPMLVLERLLRVFASLRGQMANPPDQEPTVNPADYRAVKAMLINLPLAATDRGLSAGAVVMAHTVFAEVFNEAYQCSLPDRSDEGNKWFNREHARQWTKRAYNTVKGRLAELENAGILLSARGQSDRGRGKPIHFRFAPDAAPPFDLQNPFHELPDLSGDDSPRKDMRVYPDLQEVCATPAQS